MIDIGHRQGLNGLHHSGLSLECFDSTDTVASFQLDVKRGRVDDLHLTAQFSLMVAMAGPLMIKPVLG